MLPLLLCISLINVKTGHLKCSRYFGCHLILRCEMKFVGNCRFRHNMRSGILEVLSNGKKVVARSRILTLLLLPVIIAIIALRG